MSDSQARRLKIELTPQQQAALGEQRRLIAEELPDLIARSQLRKQAAEESTLSAELRRAIRASVPLPYLCEQAGIPPMSLDEFLSGERMLRSDVMHRLAKALGLVLTKQRFGRSITPAAQPWISLCAGRA